MLTVDFDLLGVGPGDRVLDLGSGAGRHSLEASRRGATAVALDHDLAELAEVAARALELEEMLEAPLAGGAPPAVGGDALRLPFPDSAFDVVIASEVLEHIPADGAAIAEVARVVRPGGRVAVTVPRWLPEQVCWALSDRYHDRPGGHVRIYRRRHLDARLRAAGLRVVGAGHAHALHTPYWWLRCALGVDDDRRAPVRAYHRLLVWDLVERPRATRALERLLNPVLGKSLVLYCERPLAAAAVPVAMPALVESRAPA